MDTAPIRPLDPVSPLTAPDGVKPSGQAGGDFAGLVDRLASEVDQLQQKADNEVARLAAGETDNIHRVMLALGKAEIAFNYMLEVRNRLVEAYKEVMRMQV